MLQAMDIRKRFGGLDVLRGVSVQVSRGEVVAIIGRSGSGKSTLLRCLTHLETIDSGEIRIGGEPMVTTDASGAARYRRERELRPLCLKMGMVFQDYNLFPHYTVLRNLVMPQKLVLHRSAQEAEKKARALLAKVGLADKADEYPCNLSGGQWQRVAIARAVWCERARIMLLDEPTSALDPAAEALVYRNFAELVGKRSAILVSHRLGVASVVDRILVFEDGRIVEDGTLEELLAADGVFAELYRAQAQWYL